MHRDFKGVWIPREIWLNTDLKLQEKALLIEAASFDVCFAGNEHFAKFLGLSVSRVKAIISKLAKEGYLKTRQIRKGQLTVKRYIVVNEAKLIGWDQKKFEDSTENDTKFELETGLSSYHKQDEVRTENDTLTNTGLLDTGSNTSTKDIVQIALDEAFDHFWQNMALSKKAKPKAKVAFDKKVKELKVEPMFFADQLIEDTKRRQKDFGFDKLHPATYLNNQRWEDDLDKSDQQKSKAPANSFDYSVDQTKRLFGGH